MLMNVAVIPLRNNSTVPLKIIHLVFLPFGKGLTTLPCRENQKRKGGRDNPHGNGREMGLV